MSIRGTVHAANPRRGMIAIDTGAMGFTIIEVTDIAAFDVGDTVEWANNTGLGSQMYRNVSKGKDVQVYAQNHWVRPEHLRQQLLMD